MRALDLQSVRAPGGAVGQVLAFGHDALETKPAGVPEHGSAAALKVLTVTHGPLRRNVIQAARQEELAVNQADLGQIVAIKIEQVEGMKDHAFRAPGFEGILQPRKARPPRLVLYDHFAVEEPRPELQ